MVELLKHKTNSRYMLKLEYQNLCKTSQHIANLNQSSMGVASHYLYSDWKVIKYLHSINIKDAYEELKDLYPEEFI